MGYPNYPMPEKNPSTGEDLRVLTDMYELEVGELSRPVSYPDEPGPAAYEPLRPEVLKLAQKVTSRLFHKVVPTDPDYWGLAAFTTDEEAWVANHMKLRVPMTIDEIARKTKKTPEELQPLLDSMSVHGVIEYTWENPEKIKQYKLVPFVPGSAEFSVMNNKQVLEHPEITTFFERMTRLPLEDVSPMIPLGGGGVGMHVIPVEKAIAQENKSVSVEHLSHWLNKYDVYAVGPCSCRTSQMVRGENDGNDCQEWCIGVGDMATFAVETGKGRFIDYDEVLQILENAEKNGCVHQITNIDGEDKIFAICNCNANTCYGLRTSQLFNTPNLSRSAYVAEVTPSNCVACAGCVEVCPAGAVKLGQKYDTTEGPIEYPKQELPDDVEWGPEKWDEDYRNTARHECHSTGTAPCKVACPAHIAIQGYLKMAAQGRYREALALIKQENPFPAVCGRVCNKRCEDACTRACVDSSVAIDDVKRFIAEQDLHQETRFVPEKVIASNRGEFKQKIAVVGAGPAGLTCAYYLAVMGYSPVVFEKNETPGGMMVYGIPSYKLPRDVVAAEIDILRELGVEIKCGVEVGKDITLDQLRSEGFEAFYIAIGCQGGRKPRVSGDDAKDCITAVEFLRDALGNPEKEIDGDTVVVGGGNVAIDAARVSRRCGSENVHMVCLENAEQMTALPEEIVEAEEDGVEIHRSWGPVEVRTNAKGEIEGVLFKRCTSVFNENGLFDPTFDEEETMFIECKHVVMSIGQYTQWGNLLENEKVELRRNMTAVADPVTFQTAQEDVFVGGDVFTGPSFLIDAVAAGHEAAVSLHRFVQKGSSLTTGRTKRDYIALNKETMVIPDYDHHTRAVPKVDKIVEIHHRWDDPSHTLSEAEIKLEAARCLSCGAAIVDQNKCIGCGLCTTRCNFNAIHLLRMHPDASRMYTSEEGRVKAILPYAMKRKAKIIKKKLSNK